MTIPAVPASPAGNDDLLFLACLFWFVSALAGGFSLWAWRYWQHRAERAEALNAGLYKIILAKTLTVDDALVTSEEIARIQLEADAR